MYREITCIYLFIFIYTIVVDNEDQVPGERLVGSILKRLRIFCRFFGKILKLSLLNFGLLRF